MHTPSDQAALDEAACLLDSIAASHDATPATTTWALLAADRLVRAGARPPVISAVAVPAGKAARQALRLLASLSDDVLWGDAVLEALHAAQRAHASAV
jgi:hypothetical protein